MKRRQFAKMQRTLYADERISKVAENPRNQAFMRTIEDRGSDDDMDFIFAPPPPPPGAESQETQASSTSPAVVIPNSQPQAAPVSNPRRTKTGKKPSNIGEIRESLSNLLDEPFNPSSSLIPATEAGSSDDEGDRPQSSHSNSSASSNKENRNPRRSKPAPAIVDRITLKRNSSTASSTSKLAFTSATTSGTSASGSAAASASSSTFKVPALLRRATTNSLLSTTSSSSATSSITAHTTTATTTSKTTNTNTTALRSAAAAATEMNMKIKKPAGKRSGVSYLARETERRAAVAEAERRREARKFRGAEGRGKVVGGLFGGGKFE